MRHSGCGIEIDTLPKTIRDAIKVTRHLRVNRLWVDSLCIVQDDADELSREMANMASYYGNSLITISASAAKGSAEGFLRRSNTAYNHHPGTYELPFRSSTGSRGYVRLIPPRVPCSEAIDSRAWTLQEGLTSTRLVSFGRDTISWSCLSESYGEIKMGSLRRLFRVPRLSFTDWLSTSERRYYSQPMSYTDIWNEIVYEYCGRQLFDPADGLLAISAIAYEFSAMVSGTATNSSVPEYLAGLWNTSSLPFQLLWQPRKACQYPPRDVYVAPSWSWAAARAPLRRHDGGAYFRWLQHWARSEVLESFSLESCSVELRNTAAPYGALSSGYLFVRGRTHTTDASSLHAGKLGGIRISFDAGGDSAHTDFLSWFSQNLGDAPVTLLKVFASAFEDKTGTVFPTGLALAENEDGSYRRLGLLFCPTSTKLEWETRTLKLV